MYTLNFSNFKKGTIFDSHLMKKMISHGQERKTQLDGKDDPRAG